MRSLTALSCFVTALGCSVALSACSAGDEPASQSNAGATETVRLRVEAQPDGTLRLNGSPRDRSYVATYPNPDKWTSIELEIGRDGVPVVRCTRGDVVASCSETPFFIDIVQRTAATGGLSIRTSGVPGGESGSPPPPSDAPAPSGSSEPAPPSETSQPSQPSAPSSEPIADAKVTDMHGTEVASVPVGGGSPAPAGNTCGGAAQGGAPGQGGFAKNGETQACASASLADRPGCDMTTVASAAKVYCDTVNAQLPAESKIDCSTLTNPNYQPSALPSSRSGEDCSTYWEPARSAVSAAGYGSCEKVSLLFTQWRDRARHELISKGVCRSSPLVLDLDGDGIHLSALDQGTSFDLLGSGKKVWTAWTDGRDAFLALDRNGNGVIDDATELFGNATAGASYADGFAALAELDDDGNGMIDSRDRAFDHLVLWRDANRDGISAESELVTLREAGVRWLSVSAIRRDGPSSLDAHGNSIPLVTEFGRRDGSHGTIADAFFRYRPMR